MACSTRGHPYRLAFLALGILALLGSMPNAAEAATPKGKLTIKPASIKFPSTADGSTSQESLTVENTGKADLSGSVGAATDNGFSVTAGLGAFDLAPNGSVTVQLSFTPTKPGAHKGKLVVSAGKTKKSIALSGVGTPVPSGTVLLFGGVPNTIAIINKSQSFTTPADKFSAIAAMSDSRGFIHEAPYLDPSVVTGDGKGEVFISGGQDNADFILGTTLLYDPATNTYTNGPDIDARAEHTATLFVSGPLAGQVLITGGLELDGGTRIALNDQQLYDPATGSVSDTGFMNDARGQHTAALLNNGLVLVTGGYDENFDANGYNETTATAELYNPSSGTFSCVTKGADTGPTTSDCPNVMSSPRWNHRATLLADGTVLITGGTPTDSGTREGTASADLYDPVANSFSALPNMNTARQGTPQRLFRGAIVRPTGWC